jgi:lipoate-protein ligase B
VAAESVAVARVDWPGLVPYEDAWALQRQRHAARVAGSAADTLLLLEHELVVTCGRSTRPEHLPVPRDALRDRGIPVFDVERGGSVTVHLPGQLVVYPIVDLDRLGCSVVRYVRLLEQALIDTAAAYGVRAGRRRGFPGVWVEEEKIAAVGVAVKRRVALHGAALNVACDLDVFSLINPCGIGYTPTTLARAASRRVSVSDARETFAAAFAAAFGVRLEPLSIEDARAAARELPDSAASFTIV